MKDQSSSFPWDLPWGPEDPEDNKTPCNDECHGEDVHGAPWEPTLTVEEVSHLLDQMIMDIQHLELEVIRARYKLSSFLEPLIVKVVVSKKLKSFVALGSSCLSGSTMNRMSCK